MSNGFDGLVASRRAYRALGPVDITREMVEEMAGAARLAPSCFNNQPWRFVFVYGKEQLERMKDALSGGNAWARDASMIIACFSSEKDDCVIRDRKYHLFDLGMATGFLILKITDMGLVAHPVAGFSPGKVMEALGIPEDAVLLALLIVGRRSDTVTGHMSKEQREAERERPERMALDEFVFHDGYGT